jgi:hypothetical protein
MYQKGKYFSGYQTKLKTDQSINLWLLRLAEMLPSRPFFPMGTVASCDSEEEIALCGFPAQIEMLPLPSAPFSSVISDTKSSQFIFKETEALPVSRPKLSIDVSQWQKSNGNPPIFIRLFSRGCGSEFKFCAIRDSIIARDLFKEKKKKGKKATQRQREKEKGRWVAREHIVLI